MGVVESTDIMERAFKIGCSVVFFDSHRQPHEAIVTNWFHGGVDGETVVSVQQRYDEAADKRGVAKAPIHMPCCNLVFVSTDTTKGDSYGRQIERQTSCQYGGQMYVPYTGMCWCWPDEAEAATALAAKAFAEAVAK